MGLLINFMRFLATVEEGLACGGADVLKVIKFAFMLLDIAFIAIPIGLMVMLFIDFFKNVTAGKEDEMKKNLGIIIKRIIYCVVLFLVPTVVYFIVWLLGDLANFEYINCINIAKDADSAYLESVEIDYYDFDNEDGNITKTYSCYKCANDYIYVWSDKKPSGGSNGCNVDFEIDSTKHTEDRCNAAGELSCYGCNDGSGFVLSHRDPGYGFLYKNGNSFKTTTSVCRPGFVPVDMSNCLGDGVVVELSFYDHRYATFSQWRMITNFGGKYGDGNIVSNEEGIDFNEEGIDLKGLPTPANPELEFAGWYTRDGVEVTNDTIVSKNEVHTLYARWKDKNNNDVIHVGFYFGGGVMTRHSYNYIDVNSKYLELANLEWHVDMANNYKLIGWYADKSYKTEITADSKFFVFGDHALYARLEKK